MGARTEGESKSQPYCRAFAVSQALHLQGDQASDRWLQQDNRKRLRGAAYKAQFPDGLVGVVKKVRVLAPESDAFHRDLQFLARLHHRHLVGLRGFSEEHDRFLVFDYMENGSLREIIHDPLRTPLTWRARLQIATDVAASLEYLCLFCDPPPCNLTVSAENILLDGNSVAKLSTFGSMSFDGQVREPSDEEDLKGQILFQFGALILELVTGQSFGSQGADLLRWIQRADFSHSMNQMVDSDLGNAYDSSELKSLLFVARLCIKTGGRGPPSFSISHVLRFLQSKVNGADSREM
ncbi:unnamed protein product [Spirodela intermedia]|uniref:Protein kinase domain-containing protein n=1 Tax=Spirodela intermedia TaxID=51605 RepID=A0A7I8I813_SPIIN|nr:unnamed protein product [Spirodela intermedia]CAA6653745.1 unnamed protein product [Spirodela intermedia]